MPPPPEGGLQAPTRHPVNWKSPDYYDEPQLFKELERVFDLCHGCRRCVSLCQSFPTLFDLVDESATLEVDGVSKADYWKVVDHCYLCDLCYQTKCPYIPPHEWDIDFPHLMLRAKAVKHQQGRVTAAEKVLSSTDAVGKLAGISVVVNVVNAANKSTTWRKVLARILGVHPEAGVPEYHSRTLRKRVAEDGAGLREVGDADRDMPADFDLPEGALASPMYFHDGADSQAGDTGKVAIFATCFANYNAPQLGEDLIAVLRHNGLEVALVDRESCCGMPKLELGDLPAVERAMRANIPVLDARVADGWDIIAPVPSCVLMLRLELPLLFADDPAVARVAAATFDPFEYLMRLHKRGQLNTDFPTPLGKVAYHAACHQRVQKIGAQTRQCLELVPDTEVLTIERCSGHNGTYGVKRKFYESALKIGAPVVRQIRQGGVDHYGSDCPMAGGFIEHGMKVGGGDAGGDGVPSKTEHPISLLRTAYGI